MLTVFSFQLYKGRINATSHVIQHPMYGAGHKFRTLHLPVSTTLAEVLDRVSGKFAIIFFCFAGFLNAILKIKKYYIVCLTIQMILQILVFKTHCPSSIH